MVATSSFLGLCFIVSVMTGSDIVFVSQCIYIICIYFVYMYITYAYIYSPPEVVVISGRLVRAINKAPDNHCRNCAIVMELVSLDVQLMIGR